MKRGQIGEADKHAIRRKIEEKQVLIREQRKVRERLSRECADTVFHIAATEATIKSMTAQHKETLKNKEEDFRYSTATHRREVHQLEKKCAELERVVTSADVVEREHAVITARLAALRLEDEKEEVAKAREMDALKRNLFNVRNDLENVFRTTLHDLNVAYQDQAFDAMVEEATTAREELPALRRDLSSRTKHANRVIVKHCGSSTAAGYAKAERDLTKEFVKLQAQREEGLRQSLQDQKAVIKKETEEMKGLGDDLDRFQAEAVEMRAAAAELRQLKAESARAQEEYLHARAWAHTLAKKGPKALKAELKRRRLAALTAATVASFKAGSRTEAGLGPAEGADNTSVGGLGSQEDDAVEGGSDTDRTNGSSSSSSSRSHGDLGGEDAEQGGGESGSGGNGRADALPPAERRDTLTLVSGMEVGGLGVDVNAAAITASENRSRFLLESDNEGVGAVDRRRTAAARDRRDRARRWPKGESERMWRASLYGKERERKYDDITKNNGGVDADGVEARSSIREGSSSPGGMTSPSAVAVDHSTTSAAAGERIKGASTAHATATSSPPADACPDEPASAPRPGKLPTEVLASMLLSEHEFVGGKMSAAGVLERARQWEKQQQQHHQEQQQRQRQATKPLPFPDLPYGFTDLGRRINIEQPHRRGIKLEPTGGSVETASSLE